MRRCRVAWRPAILALWLALLACLSAGAAENAADPVVALVYRQEIRASELEPAKRYQQRRRDQLGTEVFRLWRDHSRQLRLEALIVNALVQSFSREQQLVVDKDEVEGYARYLRGVYLGRVEELEEERQRLDGELADRQLSAAQREALSARRAHLDKVITRFRADLEKQRESAAMPEEGLFQRSALIEAVRRWKTEKALYERYGGEVLCGRSGLEPAGALQALVEERLATFGVVILDPAYQDLLRL